jgi:hypothetical protein
MAAKQLLDLAKSQGFAFQRVAPGPRWAPVLGRWEGIEYRDKIYLSGFWTPTSCTAIRRHRSSLVVSCELPVAERVSGDALIMLHTVVSDWITT